MRFNRARKISEQLNQLGVPNKIDKFGKEWCVVTSNVTIHLGTEFSQWKKDNEQI